jgi:DGQHR domain-containing protein
LILDGQHRVFGFARAKTKLRVPVVIYNGLSRTQECRLFIDINTKQRPVPNELLLDIKRLAETENHDESFLRDVFDFFANETDSPLLGLMAASDRAKGKLTRVTFNAAVKPALTTFEDSDTKKTYSILAAYLHACVQGLKLSANETMITNPVLFKALILLFADVAPRVSDRFDGKFSVENFRQIVFPMFQKVKPTLLKSPGASHLALHANFQKLLRHSFKI